MNKYFPLGDHSLVSLVNNEIDGVVYFDKWGRNPTILTTSDPEDIWAAGGLYTGFPTGSETLEVLSSDAADTAEGTGAQTVIISGLLDANFNRMDDVTVDLDGVTPVSLGTQTYHRANRIEVIAAGSGKANAGVITLRHSTTTANIFATVAIGENQTQICQYTVPANETLYVDHDEVSVSLATGAACAANLHIRTQNNDNGIWRITLNEEVSSGKAYHKDGELPTRYPEKTDINYRIESISDNNTAASGRARGFFLKD